MHLPDSNVWLALALSKHVHHEAARDWLDAIEEPDSIVFCRATQQSMLRLLTNSSVLSPYGIPPLTNRQAWKVYEAFLSDDRVDSRWEEPAGLEERFRKLALPDSASPKLWMDAYLASFAMTAGYRMVTTDRAFRQFAGLDVEILGKKQDEATSTQ